MESLLKQERKHDHEILWMVNRLADYNPAEATRIMETQTMTDIAVSLAMKIHDNETEPRDG